MSYLRFGTGTSSALPVLKPEKLRERGRRPAALGKKLGRGIGAGAGAGF